jgi:hypothetical protein
VNELVSAFTSESQKSALANNGSSSLSQLLAEQQQQHTSSHTQANQQHPGSGHQTQAVDGSFSFDSSSATRIDIASTSAENDPSLSVSILSRQDVPCLGSMNKSLQSTPVSDEVAHSEFTARFPDLMDRIGFGAALAMFDSESSASVIGQAGQQSGNATDCDPLASIGLDIGVDAFATSGVVAPGPYGAASGIAPNRPTFAS